MVFVFLIQTQESDEEDERRWKKMMKEEEERWNLQSPNASFFTGSNEILFKVCFVKVIT